MQPSHDRQIIAIRLLAVSLVCSGIWLVAQSRSEQSRFEQARAIEFRPLPQLIVGGTEHDFGQVRPGVTLKHDFTVRNVGTRRLILSVDQCDCGDGLSTIILPGQVERVPVRLMTREQPRNQQRIIDVTTNDPRCPRIEFKLMAQIGAASAAK